MTTNEKVNILLVDDQPARLLSYEAILGGLGQNLVKVGSGVEALQRLMHDEFAVILLDVNMPGMDGFETATLIHQHPRFERTPIIFVTALHVTDMDRLTGYELGAIDYVYVPVVPEVLKSKVSVLVELYLKRRELQRLNQNLERANVELAAANSTLQAEKARELERLNGTLEQANAELARANHTLEEEIVARRRLEDVLRDADRRKDEFLAMLAHELRNPLAPIRNGAELVRQCAGDDAEMLSFCDVIDRQVEHLMRLVDDLLDVSRITQGKINLKKEPVDVGRFVARAIETSRPLIDSRGHTLEVDLADGADLRVLGDETRLAQVIGNLLNNAAKYTDRGGSIRIAVERDGDARVAIRVRDSGVGIPREMLPKVFDLFTQIGHTLERAQGGLGVGLALVQRLVLMHGGEVAASSAGPGQGSEFVIFLPVLGAGVPCVSPQPQRAPPATPSARRILVVDDNVDSALSLALLLKKEGNEVATAHDGVEALELAARFLPEVVLLDIGMPRMNGYDAARRLRDQPGGKDLLLIALTGWGQSDVRDRIQEAGFDVHIVKPVDSLSLSRLLVASDSRLRSVS